MFPWNDLLEMEGFRHDDLAREMAEFEAWLDEQEYPFPEPETNED